MSQGQLKTNAIKGVENSNILNVQEVVTHLI